MKLTSILSRGTGVLTALILGFYTNASQATLIGDEVNGCVSTTSVGFQCTDSSINFFSFNAGPITSIVGPGTEFNRVLGPGSTSERTLSADLTSNQITLTVDGTNSTFVGGSHSANQWHFFDLDWIGEAGSVTGLTVDVDNGLTVSGLSFTADSITIDTAGISFSVLNGNVFSTTLLIETTHDAIPEPGAIALLGFGVVGLGYARRIRAA